MLPKLRALFFATGNGREPVRDWLMGLRADERKQVGTDIAYVQFAWPIGKPRVDHLRGPRLVRSGPGSPIGLRECCLRWPATS